ncbi:MAG: site-specific DNA-methyltransferase [Candidatus Humimicrobiaceae bacterium]
MEIIKIPITKINPAPYNPRLDLQPGDAEYEKIKRSITEFDLVEPLVWNKQTGNLVGGHQRLKVLKEQGIIEVEVSVVDLPPAKEKALNIVLNKAQGDWDLPKLKDLLQELDTGEFPIEITGFGNDELENLMNQINPDKVDEDDFNIEEEAEKIKEPKTKRGDIYTMGDHKLICGDSTKEETYKALLEGKQADMVFTDPPYNVNYSGQGKLGGILNDNMAEEKFVEFTLDFVARIQENLKTGGVFYMCSGWSSYPIFVYAIKAFKMEFANPIVWVKNNTTLGWNDYKYKYEMVVKGKNKGKNKDKKSTPILYGWNGGRHYFIETRFESDVWEIKRKASNQMVHPTQKPLELIAKAITNSSHRGEIVLDNFSGSGATLMACEKTKRKFYGIELDPKYCDVIIARWEKYTEKKAVLSEELTNDNTGN